MYNMPPSPAVSPPLTVPFTNIVWLVVKEVPFIEAVRRPSVFFVVVFVMKGVVLVALPVLLLLF
jgi:hypothetical protein